MTVDIVHYSNVRAPVVRASDRHPQDPDSSPGWISVLSFRDTSTMQIVFTYTIELEQILVQVCSVPVKSIRPRDEGGTTGLEDMIQLR